MKIDVFDYLLSFDASSARNPHEYPHIARNHSHCVMSLPLILWVYLHSNFRGGLRKCMYFETECEMAVQGHPRSLISERLESAYTTSYWLSIVTMVLSCPVSEILQVFCVEQRPHPHSTRILCVFRLHLIADVVAPRCEDPKLIIRVINFKLV